MYKAANRFQQSQSRATGAISERRSNSNSEIMAGKELETLTNPLIFSDSDLTQILNSDWPEFMSKWPRRDLSGSGGRDAAFWRSY